MIAKVLAEAKLPVEEEEYVQSFRPQLMDVVNLWTQGAPFSQICKMTDAFEGASFTVSEDWNLRVDETKLMCQAANIRPLVTCVEQIFTDL